MKPPYRRRRRFGKRYLGYGADAPQMTDGGRDEPLSTRGYLLWCVLVVVVVGALVLLAVVSR